MAPESIHGVDPRTAVERAQRIATTRPQAAPSGGPGFDKLLADRLNDQAAQPLRWSAHARDRLIQRGIQVTPEVAQRLEDAVATAAAKGSRDSVVMVDDTAFVVSIANRVVVTAVDQAGMKDHVFTNIDSAVLAR